MSWNVIKYVLKAALRDKLIISLIILVALGLSVSVFIGSTAVIEANQFALVFAAGGLRVIGVLGLVLFVVFYVRRSFDNKDVEYLLSRPISRVNFIFSHSIAFSLLACFFALIISSAVFLLSINHFGVGHFLWSISLMFELIIMVNVALFFSMVLPSAASVSLAVLAFYVFSRIMGQLLGIIDQGMSIAGFEYISVIFQLISLIIPRLDLMAQTNWLVYGVFYETSLAFIVIHGVGYSLFVALAAVVDLVRRQF